MRNCVMGDTPMNGYNDLHWLDPGMEFNLNQGQAISRFKTARVFFFFFFYVLKSLSSSLVLRICDTFLQQNVPVYGFS